MTTQQAVQEKAKEVEEIKSFLEQYKVLGIANLQKVRAAQLQELKKKLKEIAYLRVVKNTLMERAISQCKNKPGLEKLQEYLTGPNVFLLTNVNPFKLALLLDKNKVKTTAKAGDIAAEDIIIPAGNTGLPPGPVISQLNAVGLPTRIESGSVYISRETLVAKKGDVISERLASVLSKLGIKPVEVGLSLRVAYDDGIVIDEQQLHIDLVKFRQELETAHNQAFNLSINAAYPLSENIAFLLQKAHQEAYNLSISANIPTPETIKELIRKAYVEMLSLSTRIAMKDEKAAPPDLTKKN
jgi:large subunit ribosomal protein L10